MRLLTFCFLIAITITASGCNSLTVHLPVSRFDPPEVAGETWKKHLGIGGGGTHDVVVAQDASARPPNVSAPTISQGGDVPLKFSLGLWERLEVGFRLGLTNGIAMGAAKFQILGDPMAKSKGGNFSLAVTAAAGAGSSTNSGNQLGTFGPGGYPWNATATTQIQDYAVVAGIRLSDYVLLYGGPFISKYYMTGTIHDSVSDNGSSPAADYSISGSGQNSGGNLAMQINTSAKGTFSITLEGVYSNFQWGGTSGSNDIQSGVLLDWFW